MKICNIRVELEINEEQKLHRVNLIDANAREKIVEGSYISTESIPSVELEGLQFVVFNNQAYVSYESLVTYINQPKIIGHVEEKTD